MPRLLGLALAGLLLSPSALRPASVAAPRIRIVPQTSDGLLQDIEESRDGTRLLTHDKGYAPRLWDAKRQVLLTVLSGHPDRVNQVGFSPSGKQVLTRSLQELRIWDSSRAKLLATFSAPTGEELTAAAFSPDGSKIGVGTGKGAVFVVEASDPSKFVRLGTHTKTVNCISFSPDSQRMISGADDATGRMWDVAANVPLWQVKGHSGPVRWAVFSPSGEYVLTTGLDDNAVLWDRAGKALQIYKQAIGNRSVVNVQMAALFVGKNGEEIAAAEPGGTIDIFKVGSSTPVRKLEGHTSAIRELRASHDGAYLATYAGDETLRMWDVAAGKEIAFDPEEGLPTAGEFSPTRNVFWLGYDEGAVRQFDVKTGKSTKETLGSVTTLGTGRLVGNAAQPTLWLKSNHDRGLFGGGKDAQNLFIDPTGMNKSIPINISWEEEWFSPDGRYLAVTSRQTNFGFALLDLVADKVLIKSELMLSASWSPDGTHLVLLDNEDNSVGIYNLATDKIEHTWQWPLEKKEGGLHRVIWHPNGRWLVSGSHVGFEVKLWDAETGKEVVSFGKLPDFITELMFTPDGKKLLAFTYSGTSVFDVATGKRLYKVPFVSGAFSSDVPLIAAQGTRLLMPTYNGPLVVLDLATGKPILSRKACRVSAISDDGKHILTSDGTQAVLTDVDTQRELLHLDHADEVTNLQFFNERIMTTDKVGGLNVWDMNGQKLASMVLLRDGSWLAYDPQGRFDAPEPNAVTGAYFVLEWEGGLEPIAMPQLKSQFYEPHLLAKALGLDKEALRDVPSLESLRLAPDLMVKPSGEMTYSITATERDNGGVGAISVSVNGKEVVRKKSANFLKFNLADYTSYLLPESMLTDGRKNLLSVTVTNENGDLASLPETLDVGAPKELKVPDVHLYGLFVGTGDYVGKSGDLTSPPSDAKALEAALKTTGERLLPGKIDVTLLSTAEGERRPTRENVLAWLVDTSKKATSADVVFVFLAGHGMSKIGDRGGYYYLTSEADPGDITPATAATSTISGEELRVALAAIPAGKQIVVLDTCHSGAATDSLFQSRSVSGEYQRAFEAIRDTSGTWLLAGAASDQLSYESPNVDHGMLTYALLEAIDKASPDGLRTTPSGEMFIDVERWLNYAANRVESLKQEVGIKGIQRPEFKRATQGSSFDIGVVDSKKKGFLDLKPPRPIVIVGSFQQDEEDPLNLEDAVAESMRDSKSLKPWFDVTKHPNVYRMAGTYSSEGDVVKVKLILQQFDERQQRKNLESVEVTGDKAKLPTLAAALRKEIEARIVARATAKSGG